MILIGCDLKSLCPNNGESVCVCGKPWIKGYKQGAIPLIIGGWPTKRPMMRAANVPANFYLQKWPGG